MHYKLPELPYTYSELFPYIDTETMEIHHSKILNLKLAV